MKVHEASFFIKQTCWEEVNELQLSASWRLFDWVVPILTNRKVVEPQRSRGEGFVGENPDQSS